jgi:hypothetical protein
MAASSPCIPSRTRQSISISSASRENCTGVWTCTALRPPRARRISLAASSSGPSSSGVSARNSMSSAAEVGGSSFHASGTPGMFQAAAIRVGATISSVAVAPAPTSSPTAAAAPSRSSKPTRASVVWRPSGTVSNTASATKASVPSEPMTRRRKISSGVSASRNAHSR